MNKTQRQIKRLVDEKNTLITEQIEIAAKIRELTKQNYFVLKHINSLTDLINEKKELNS